MDLLFFSIAYCYEEADCSGRVQTGVGSSAICVSHGLVPLWASVCMNSCLVLLTAQGTAGPGDKEREEPGWC